MFWIHLLLTMSLGIPVLSSSTMVYEVTTNSQDLNINATAENVVDKVRVIKMKGSSSNLSIYSLLFPLR